MLNEQAQIYILDKKDIYEHVLSFLEKDDSNDRDFLDLLQYIHSKRIRRNRQEYELFLRMIISIANTHHRSQSFFTKIEILLLQLGEEIKHIFSNADIFSIFSSNKKILLFLIENKIITVDQNICIEIFNLNEPNGTRYCHFFFPEIKPFIKEETIKHIENELLSIDSNIFHNFDKKRHEGENDSYICSLIRNDAIDDFISYVNQSNLPLTIQISPSLFETNSYLIENTTTTLIEYAAFFGSTQIFHYLRMNNVELNPLLWYYSIHSKNAELIHFIESNGVKPETKTYDDYLIEAIKCHHNDIAEYIQNYCQLSKDIHTNELFIYTIIQCQNYSYWNHVYSSLDANASFFYLYCFDYFTIVNLMVDLWHQNRNIPSVKGQSFYSLSVYDRLTIVNKLDKDTTTKYGVSAYLAIPPCVISIGQETFDSQKLLERVKIPFSVGRIDERAFCNCTSLVSVTIPSSVTKIEKETFQFCESLKEVIIPSSITEIGSRAFYYCAQLKSVTIPFSVTKIGSFAFSNCRCLQHVFLSPNLIVIDEEAFSECIFLKEIILPPSLKTIKKYAFRNCQALRQLTIPSSVTFIGDGAFDGCQNLNQLTVDSEDYGIQSYAFCGMMTMTIFCSTKITPKKLLKGCSSLISVSIMSPITVIGEFCFYGCDSLKKLTIPDSVTSYDSHSFCDCRSLRNIRFPPHFDSIEPYAFFGCKFLEISLPNSLKNIGSYAFAETSIREITVPPSVTSIG
ncbi:hypothetical protein M9Y10_024391 [Tritrichomonas musculus]|uniref:Surface antigen BspA-like n=1 Tax=Tritrichomonas musculus TaxID=1915356 RepID=A0ABR2HBT2_9EUKA